MKRIVDEHNFEVSGLFGTWGRARLQIFSGETRTLVLLTQYIGAHDGSSLTNNAEQFADALRDRYFPQTVARTEFIHWYLFPEDEPSWESGSRAHLLLTTFDEDGMPHWSQVDPLTVELLHRYADPGRGDAYIPPPIAPTSMTKWVQFPGNILPRPQYLFRAPCMRPGIARVINRYSQRRGRARCQCWYHAGNWHIASALAIEALTQIDHDRPDIEDVRHLGVQAALEHPIGAKEDWVSQAACSLLADPIILDNTLDGYINGQHRSEAIADQRVATVPLIISFPIGSTPPAPLFRSIQKPFRG